MRPSEAAGMLACDLGLPSDGWGMAILRGATTAPGCDFTDDAAVTEDKDLKQRAEGATRDVPLPPGLVSVLRRHLAKFPIVDGRVFSTSTGAKLTSTSYTENWKWARAQVWPAGSRLGAVTLYDWRHSIATALLRSGVSSAEVALRLGHSVQMLNRVYAGVFEDDQKRANDLFDSQYGETDPPSASPEDDR